MIKYCVLKVASSNTLYTINLLCGKLFGMGNKTEDDFWFGSNLSAFSFEDEEKQKPTTNVAESNVYEFETDSVFTNVVPENAMLPIHSIISKKCLEKVLEDVKLPMQTSVLPVKETITKMCLEQAYILHVYRSLDLKLELLDEAVKTLNGNIILSVILFLVRTLRPNILFRHLSKREVALQHYSNYLMQQLRLQELGDLYMATGSNCCNVADIFYISCKDTTDKKHIFSKLEQFMAQYSFKCNSEYDKTILSDYMRFLQWQIDKNMNSESVIEQLAVLCKNEWEKGSGKDDTEIVVFKKLMNISDYQYEWVQLNTLCVLEMWKQLTELFIKANWLTKKNNIKTLINPELFVTTLHKHEAPINVIEQFLYCMADVDNALAFAEKIQCHKFIVNTFISQRDRLALLNYKKKLRAQSEEFFYTENSLRSTDKKWKN